MAIKDICSRWVVFVRRGETVTDAARLMREHHVGSVVVVEEHSGRRVPVGMLTDRDIAIGVVALGLDPGTTTAETAMRGQMVSVSESDDMGRAVSLMRAQGVRRVPVVDDSGALVGMIAADDLFGLFADELSGLASIIRQGAEHERAVRSAVL